MKRRLIPTAAALGAAAVAVTLTASMQAAPVSSPPVADLATTAQVADAGTATERPAERPPSDTQALAGRSVLLLGDSLAAGEGGGKYLTGTDELYQRCHRSAAGLFAGTGAEVTNLGCSRATTENLVAPQQHPEYNLRAEPGQLLAAGRGRAADWIVVFVGGNNIRFADIFNRCVLSEDDCTADSAFTRQALLGAESVQSTLSRSYGEVAAALGGQVLVPAYPQLFGTSDGDCGRVSPAEAAFARELISALNLSIRKGVEAAASTHANVRFIPDTEDALSGHGACDPEPFVHTVLPTSLISAAQEHGAGQELLHPTAAGYSRLTQAITRWLAKPAASTPAP